MGMKTSTAKSPSSFPHFHPHVTLATVSSTVAVEDLRGAVPEDQLIVPVTFKKVEVGDKYFMSIYVTVHQDGALGALRDALTEALGEEKIPPKSHVSLFYIDDSEPEERDKMMQELEARGRIVDRGEDKAGLDCSEFGSRAANVVEAFDGAEIWLALCDGPVETWSVEGKIRLK